MTVERALEHPLPAGMRDILPDEARTLAGLGRELLGCFELYGYQRVTVPAFEYAGVLERGLGALDPREVLRFVEPESGEVVALRPDMTPQIARLVATRLCDAPGPARLCYEGSVVRLRRERARRHRQIPQAGIELVGAPAPGGDREVLEVAAAALRAVGLGAFLLDLGHARIAGSLLDAVPLPAQGRLVEALTQKDPRELERRAQAAGLGDAERRALVALTDLHGGEEIWPRAEALLASTPASGPARELRAVWQAVRDAGLAPRVSVDLGEVRDLGYYTGVTFQIFAEGPGQPVGSGGRYDRLFEKFGAPRPAAGFALSLDDLRWALGGGLRAAPHRVLVRTSGEPTELLAALRRRGVPCAAAGGGDALVYARSWGYSHLLELTARAAELVALDGARQSLAASGADAIADSVARALNVAGSLAVGDAGRPQ